MCIPSKNGANAHISPETRRESDRPETGGEGEATCWAETRLKQKELFHPAAIECSLPVCIDWAPTALVILQW